MKNKATQLIAIPGGHDFFILREFDFPVELLFAAFTEPELLAQWFMPVELGLEVLQMDCQTGGSYQLRYTGPAGNAFGFRGVYHEVLGNDRIIRTSEFEGLPQRVDPVLEKTTFENLEENRCRVTIHSICPSVEYRDNMIAAGMEPTLDITHRQLDRLLHDLLIKQQP